METGMTVYDIAYLKEAHKASIFHQNQIWQSEVCGCFYCISTFTPDKIEDWADENDHRGATALCPKCRIDSILGSASGFPVTENDFLIQMNKYWF
jgi:hypothetical protein